MMKAADLWDGDHSALIGGLFLVGSGEFFSDDFCGPHIIILRKSAITRPNGLHLT